MRFGILESSISGSASTTISPVKLGQAAEDPRPIVLGLNPHGLLTFLGSGFGNNGHNIRNEGARVQLAAFHGGMVPFFTGKNMESVSCHLRKEKFN
jgi:succinate-acetate transporter protein